MSLNLSTVKNREKNENEEHLFFHRYKKLVILEKISLVIPDYFFFGYQNYFLWFKKKKTKNNYYLTLLGHCLFFIIDIKLRFFLYIFGGFLFFHYSWHFFLFSFRLGCIYTYFTLYIYIFIFI